MLIEFIDYQATSIETSYLALKKNYLTEELKFLNNDNKTDEELLQLKKRHLNLIFDWVNELSNTDSQLLKYYYFDGMILEDIASLLSISKNNASVKHSSIMKKMNNNPLMNIFPYKKAPLYSEYLIYKEKEKEKEKKDNQKKYERKSRLKKKNKRKAVDNFA